MLAKLQFAFWVALVLCVFGTANVRADDAKPDDAPPAANAPPTEEIGNWIKDLSSDDFEARKSATRKLVEAGKPVIEPLSKAVDGNDLETTVRGMSVLTELARSPDEDLRKTARTALEELAKSKNRAVAQRAEAVIKPLNSEPVPQPGIGGGININVQGNIIQGNVGARLKIRSQQGPNGRQTEVDDNDRQILIDEPNDGPISIKVTEPPDAKGERKAKSYEAKTLDELKKNHPEAFELYDKYRNNNGRVGVGNQVRIQFGNPARFPVPAPFGPLPVIPAPPPRLIGPKGIDDIAQTRKQIEKTLEQLESLAGKEKATPEEIKEAARQLKQALDRLVEVQHQLGER
jgi:hypothetical protein